jgi:hypothetical protein
MQWPGVIQGDTIQSRLINEGVPYERAVHTASQAGLLKLGDRFRVERAEGDLFLYAQGAGMFVVSDT